MVRVLLIDDIEPRFSELEDLLARNEFNVIDITHSYEALKVELDDAKSKLLERKLVEKAKGILMRNRNLPEDQAYRALRKLAMDKNQKLGEVAQQVIDVAALLG